MVFLLIVIVFIFVWLLSIFNKPFTVNRVLDIDEKVKVYKGVLGDVTLSIPSVLIKHPVVYVDESIWSKTYDPNSINENSQIQSFSLNVTWPLFEPVEKKANDNEMEIMITPVSWPVKIALSPLDGLSRYLQRLLDHPDIEGVSLLPKEAHYEVKQFNKELQLMNAIPVGPGTEDFFLQNKEIFWNKNGRVNTLIRCMNGKFKSNKSIRMCEHFFIWSEMRAKVTLYYEKKILVNWKEIENKSRQLILSLSNNK